MISRDIELRMRSWIFSST